MDQKKSEINKPLLITGITFVIIAIALIVSGVIVIINSQGNNLNLFMGLIIPGTFCLMFSLPMIVFSFFKKIVNFNIKYASKLSREVAKPIIDDIKEEKNVSDSDNIKCPKCMSGNKKGAKFCSSCGEPLTKRCMHCNEEINVGDLYCNKCGKSN